MTLPLAGWHGILKCSKASKFTMPNFTVSQKFNSFSLDSSVFLKYTFRPYLVSLSRRHKALADILSWLDSLLYSSKAPDKYHTIRLNSISRSTGYCLRTIRKWIGHLESVGVLTRKSYVGFADKFKINPSKIKELFGGQKNQENTNEEVIKTPASLPLPPASLLENYYLSNENKENKQQGPVVGDIFLSSTKKPKPILKNKKQLGNKDELCNNLIKINIDKNQDNGQNSQNNSKGKSPRPKIKNKNSIDNLETNTSNIDDRDISQTNTSNIDDRDIPQTNTSNIDDRDISQTNTSNIDDRDILQTNTNAIDDRDTPQINTNAIDDGDIQQPNSSSEFARREIDRSHLLDTASSFGVQFDDFLLNYCLSVSVETLTNAISALEQQTINKRRSRAIAQGMGESDYKTNPRYNISNPANYLFKAIQNKWKPNRAPKAKTSVSDITQTTDKDKRFKEVSSDQLRMTVSQIKSMYPKSQWIEVAEHFGYSSDDL